MNHNYSSIICDHRQIKISPNIIELYLVPMMICSVATIKFMQIAFQKTTKVTSHIGYPALIYTFIVTLDLLIGYHSRICIPEDNILCNLISYINFRGARHISWIYKREIKDVPFPDGSEVTIMLVAVASTQNRMKAKGVIISNSEF